MGYCYLLDLKNLKQWEFLAIAENSLSYRVNIDSLEIYQGNVHPYEFRNISAQQRSFTVGLDAVRQGQNCDQVFAAFQKLQNTPLAFQWGNNDVFSPCVIVDTVRYQKKTWNNEGTMTADLSFTLMQISQTMLV